MTRTGFADGMSKWAMRHGLLVFALALASCAGPNLAVMSVTQANGQLAQGYQIGAGDKLRVTVFDEPDLTGEFSVGEEGHLALPLIDAFDASGMGPAQVGEAIAQRYLVGGYVLSPRVSVEVLEYRPYFILGEVNTPGEYEYGDRLTLDQAVAKAAGYTPRADRSSVILLRQDWDTARRIQLDGTPLEIAPGDTITVREAFF